MLPGGLLGNLRNPSSWDNFGISTLVIAPSFMTLLFLLMGKFERFGIMRSILSVELWIRTKK